MGTWMEGSSDIKSRSRVLPSIIHRLISYCICYIAPSHMIYFGLATAAPAVWARVGNAVLPDNIIPIPFDQSPSFALIPPHRHSEGPNGSICIARRYSPLPFLSWRKCSLSYWSRMVPKMLFRRWQPSIREGGGTADTGKATQGSPISVSHITFIVILIAVK